MTRDCNPLHSAVPETFYVAAPRPMSLTRFGRDPVQALLVDVDPFFSRDLREVARRSNQLDFHLTAFRSVAETQVALERGPVDMIFIDYWFDGETSVPFLHRLTERGGPPCVVVTALDAPDIRRIAFRAGARAFVSRDALSAQILDAVTMAVLRPRFAFAS